MQKPVERQGMRLTNPFHGYPYEQLSGEYARGLIKMILGK